MAIAYVQHLTFSLYLQDSSKIDDLTKECEDSTNQIPKLEDNIPKLQKLLLDEEKLLEEIKENAKGCHSLTIKKLYIKIFFNENDSLLCIADALCINKINLLCF